MQKAFIVALALAIAAPAAAQSLQPGEWEFTATGTSPALPKPQTHVFKQCIKKEDADDPERWMGNKGKPADCKVTPGKRTADGYTWQMSCPKSGMNGSGSARMAGGTMESDMVMHVDMKGQKFEMRTRMTGKRLGPCKS